MSDMKPNPPPPPSFVSARTSSLFTALCELVWPLSASMCGETHGFPPSYLLNLQAFQTFPQGQDELLRLAVEGAQVRHVYELPLLAGAAGAGATRQLSACEEPSWPSPKS